MDIMQPPRLAMLSRTTVLASQHQILYGDSFPTITTGITVIYVFWCFFDAFHADWFLVFEYVCLWWVWWGFRCCAQPASKDLGLFFVAQSCPFQCACNPWHSENAIKINKEEVSRERERERVQCHWNPLNTLLVGMDESQRKSSSWEGTWIIPAHIAYQLYKSM